jgi:hypothetical protein
VVALPRRRRVGIRRRGQQVAATHASPSFRDHDRHNRQPPAPLGNQGATHASQLPPHRPVLDLRVSHRREVEPAIAAADRYNTLHTRMVDIGINSGDCTS